MPVFPVAPSPNKISGIFTRPYLVKNGGVKTVYLGQDSSLTVGTQSISLPAGGSLNWSGETELWACTAPGETSNLEILYTGDSAFVPGPSQVDATITDPVTINGPSRELANGVANLIPVSNASPGYQGTNQPTIVTLYPIPTDVQSLYIRAYMGDVIPTSTSVLQTGYLWLQWYSSNPVPGPAVQIHTEAIPLAYGFTVNTIIPKRADYLRITAVNPIPNPAISTCSITARVIGFSTQVEESFATDIITPTRSSISTLQINSEPFSFFNISDTQIDLQGITASTATLYTTISHKAGPTTISVRTGSYGAGQNVTLSLRGNQPEVNGSSSYGFAFTSGPLPTDSQLSFQAILPPLPLQLVIQRSAAFTFRAAIELSAE